MSFQPTATVYAYSPILPAAPAPFCDVKLRTRFWSVVRTYRMNRLRSRSTTRLLKLTGLTSLTVAVFRCAPREVPEAHCLNLPLLTPGIFDSGPIV